MTLRNFYVENKEWRKNYLGSKRGHLTRFLSKTKERAAAQNLPHDIDLDYLTSIATDSCPVFGTPFVWGQGNGAHPYRPSVDRIIPELGYVKGNLAFISLKANTIKQDVTEKELYAVADWLHEARKKVNANKRTATPVSKGTNSPSEIYPELGSFSTTGPWQDSDNPDNHSGTIQGEDADHSARESSRDGMGIGVQEMGTFVTSYDIQNNGLPCAENILAEQRRRHLPD